MSTKIKGPNGNGSAQGVPNMDFAYRSVVSSSQQKLFEKVLNEVRSDAVESSKQEINSLQQEIKGLQSAKGTSQKIDQIRNTQSQETSESGTRNSGTVNDLTTSALLRLAALHPQGGANLSGYYTNVLGTRASNTAASTSTPSDDTNVAPAETAARPKSSQGPGSLSARFESGENGVGTIGYDDSGGTSYGIYQISSRVGTMQSFLDYMQERAPDLASRLKAAGRSNTGSASGSMPKEWKKIASEDPERFVQLQHDFIEKTHYLPAVEEVYRRTGFDVEKQSQAMQEVLWSSAVQHGSKGAANIFCKAIEQGRAKGQEVPEHKLIDSVYSSRVGYLGGLSRDVREAVSRRFQEERSMALAMLAAEATSSTARA
jgi:hypothetical protein